MATSKRTTKAKPAKEPKAKKAPSEPMVVFAIRVPVSERDALHKMAGSGKSTKLVRALIAAAVAGDTTAFQQAIAPRTK